MFPRCKRHRIIAKAIAFHEITLIFNKFSSVLHRSLKCFVNRVAQILPQLFPKQFLRFFSFDLIKMLGFDLFKL